jgi:hypothetical protein
MDWRKIYDTRHMPFLWYIGSAMLVFIVIAEAVLHVIEFIATGRTRWP